MHRRLTRPRLAKSNGSPPPSPPIHHNAQTTAASKHSKPTSANGSRDETRTPKPFIRTKPAEEILESLKRLLKQTTGAEHYVLRICPGRISSTLRRNSRAGIMIFNDRLMSTSCESPTWPENPQGACPARAYPVAPGPPRVPHPVRAPGSAPPALRAPLGDTRARKNGRVCHSWARRGWGATR